MHVAKVYYFLCLTIFLKTNNNIGFICTIWYINFVSATTIWSAIKVTKNTALLVLTL